MSPRSLAFVMPFGEPRHGFFPDTLLGLMCAEARAAGIEAAMVRVYYDGADPVRDEEVRHRLVQWLDARDVDTVVVDRLFDASPFANRRLFLVTRGDSFDETTPVDGVIGTQVGTTSRGTRRTPTPGELIATFHEVVLQGRVQGAPSTAQPISRYAPVVDHDVIALDSPPPLTQRTIFGNQGCPYGDDPSVGSSLVRDLVLPERTLARLGCAFCAMGGDYEKRPSHAVVDSLVEQARYLASHAPQTEALVLDDQYAIPLLAPLMRAAADLRPLRWLFAARADTLVREHERLDKAIDAAEAVGHVLEIYLTGFEAFSDVELERYNKGLRVEDLIEAVRLMRTLARRGGFRIAEARGHSLILWNPWTRPEDLVESIEVMRHHGLASLFDEVGRNRLRLYPDLPLYYAAKRDGALLDDWVAGDEGKARRKGYNAERPWRFLDARTRVAHEIAEHLRGRLGSETEMAQLRAAAAAARAGIEPKLVFEGLDTLEDTLKPLLDASRATPRRASQERAKAVHVFGDCNNGCASCPNRDRFSEALVARVRGSESTLLCGREPTLHPEFMAALQEGARVGVVTNARRFAYRSFAHAACSAGLVAASVKLFGASDLAADAITRDSGAHQQTLLGVKHLQARDLQDRDLQQVCALEARLVPHASTLGGEWIELVRSLGLPQVRLEFRLDAIGLGSLTTAARSVERWIRECSEHDLGLEAQPISAATTNWIPSNAMVDS